MLKLYEGVPKGLEHIARLPHRRLTHIVITDNLSHTSSFLMKIYEEFGDHNFMIGRLATLRIVPCSGYIDVCPRPTIGKETVNGEVYYWQKTSGVILSELGDMLATAAKRFAERHPEIRSWIRCTMKPSADFVPVGNMSPLTLHPPRS